MMNTTEFGTSKNVLYDGIYKAVPVTIDSENVTAVDGKKVMPAGTLIKGASASVFTDREQNAVATTGASGDIDGILLYDVDVTDGDAPGSCVYHATVWADKVEATISANVRSKLNQITFVQG